ncbi:hypothetical protein HC248_02710 [Polaromonas vacuolata]|uniref:Uncharacterized protein n=1 Tax=Polaromonas vacuolata TaxID=37448 RepID=A0A6H2HBY5_9BURK|nr:hypothetical protein [Polaromonas vacuolata]QJC57385.1 hypothetical protein HC248_02710 [Polaromonas vacuolata]
MKTKFQFIDSIEILPFRVEVATASDLEQVAKLRVSCYGKHLPAVAAKLFKPEASDYELGCEVFVAKSKMDDTVIGSLRTHANVLAPLPIEASLDLPSEFFGTRMVEGTRLCIQSGLSASLVRASLLKAQFKYCEENSVESMVATGRKPVDRMYDGLHFLDIAEQNVFYAMEHVGGLLHRAMYLPMLTGEETWRLNKHPLHKFFFETDHPDIDITGAKPLNMPWSTSHRYSAPQQHCVDYSMGLSVF